MPFDHPKAGDNLCGVLFLFHLFIDVPLEQNLGRIILLFQRQFVQGVNETGHLGFIAATSLNSSISDFQVAGGASIALSETCPPRSSRKLKNFMACSRFLAFLDAHPLGKAAHVLVLRSTAPWKDTGRGIQLLINLFADRVLHCFTDHRCLHALIIRH